MPLLTDGEINDFIREMATKEEFCLNSNQWIRFMIINRPPKSCPYVTDNFSSCDNCSYRMLRTPTKYFIRKNKLLRGE